MQMGIVFYFVLMGIMSFIHILPAYTLLFVLMMNALSYWLYSQDKEAAQLGIAVYLNKHCTLLAFRRLASCMVGTTKTET